MVTTNIYVVCLYQRDVTPVGPNRVVRIYLGRYILYTLYFIPYAAEHTGNMSKPDLHSFSHLFEKHVFSVLSKRHRDGLRILLRPSLGLRS
jgi:hypothetical protein